MIDRIVAALRELGLEPTADDVRDAIWLALHMRPVGDASGGPWSAGPSSPPAASEQLEAPADRQPTPAPEAAPPAPPAEEEAVHLAGVPGARSPDGTRGVLVRTPGVPSLPDALGIGRALRPLMRRVPSRSQFLLDEQATVDRIVDEGLWLPVVRPGPSRWLELALIVDESASMPLWRSTIAELRLLLERHGAFRDVRTWSLSTGAGDGKPVLSVHRGETTGRSPQGRARNPLELVDPAGQRLLLVVTDGISPAWRSGGAGHLIARWGQAGPVAILQMLPERLWPRTALAAEPAELRLPYPGAPNSRLLVRPRSPWPSDRPRGSLPVPVMALDRRWMAPWAMLLAGADVGRFSGSVAYVGGAATGRRQRPDSRSSPAEASAQERLQRFRATASPLAYKLAGYLAAAPLTLPVMRLVQEVMVPHSTLAHLAEVYLSGLIERRTPVTAPVPPDGVQYDFREGIRDLLLNAVLRNDAMFVLRRVGEYLERRNEVSFGFSALLADPNSRTPVTIDTRSQPFAVVAANVLGRLGDAYEPAAAALSQQLGLRERITVRPRLEPPPVLRCPFCDAALDESDRFCQACGSSVRRDGQTQQLRVVTIVFCDVVDATRLERQLGPGAARRLLDRYGQVVTQVLSGHGSSVTRRRGDGFMAVFGLLLVHHDDAFRAVRAADELRAAVDELAGEVRQQANLVLRVRIGVNTGSVLVRDAGTLEEELTGTAVNLAKRFEEAAGAGEILLGEETYRLVADDVVAEPAVPVAIRGFDEPQIVWRLVEVLASDRPGRRRRPLVGRSGELELLRLLFERAVAERSCHLVSVLGSAGVGKSRLVDEFVGTLGDRAQVLRGRCLAYGDSDSVTLWPMVEVVHQAAGIAPDDLPEQARARLVELLGPEEQRVAEQLARLQSSGRDTPLTRDTFSALQRLLEILARRRPLVLVVDDLQWADPLLLDFIEEVAAQLKVPLMVICLSRDELQSSRTDRGLRSPQSMMIEVRPLSELESGQLVELLLAGQVDQAVQAYLYEWAEGNPLLVEELVATLREQGRLRGEDGRWVLTPDSEEAVERRAGSFPTSIHALLRARLDRLDPRGRAVIEPAAVVGELFHLGDIAALYPQASPAELDVSLQELIRLDLISPDHGPSSAPLPPNLGPAYRFRHVLIKNVAYELLADDRRAELHERYADWLERVTEDRRSQFDEIVGHHLSEALRYIGRLDPDSDHAAELARRAGERYVTAGQRAAVRGDTRLVLAWLGRAVRLLPAEHPMRLTALPLLAEAQQADGKLTEATQSYQELARWATASGNEGLAQHATIGRLRLDAVYDPQRFREEHRNRLGAAIAAFERLEDRLGLAMAWHLLAYLDWTRGRLTPAEAAVERARTLAREAGDPGWEANAIGLQCLIHYAGPKPLEMAERRSREALAEVERSGVPGVAATAYQVLARVAAHRGDRDEARRLVDLATAIGVDQGVAASAFSGTTRAFVRMLAGDLAAAEESLRTDYRQLEEMGGTGPLADVATMLARVLLLRERYHEAEVLARTCERLAAPTQADAQIKWRSILAIVLARRGEPGEAEPLAREAVSLAAQTDLLDSQAEAHVDLAQVLLLAGAQREATQQLERAITLYQEKGNEVGERGARKLLLAR
jgi:predicted ATPase/class 3 adenylate cyclase